MTVFAVCLAASALLNPTWAVLIVLFAVAGLASGLVAPARDLMIRSVTPPGDMGKVFGFVATGFNLGGLLAPPFFGYLLDHSDSANRVRAGRRLRGICRAGGARDRPLRRQDESRSGRRLSGASRTPSQERRLHSTAPPQTAAGMTTRAAKGTASNNAIGAPKLKAAPRLARSNARVSSNSRPRFSAA